MEIYSSSFDNLDDLINDLVEVVKNRTAKTAEKKTVSQSELKEMFKDEIKKQVNAETAKYRDVLKELVDRICKLEDWQEDRNEELDGLWSEIDTLKDFVGLEEDCCYDCEDEDCECDVDDFSFEDTIIADVNEAYGLDGFTVSDGENAAIVIPLDDDFDLKQFSINYLSNN